MMQLVTALLKIPFTPKSLHLLIERRVSLPNFYIYQNYSSSEQVFLPFAISVDRMIRVQTGLVCAGYEELHIQLDQ